MYKNTGSKKASKVLKNKIQGMFSLSKLDKIKKTIKSKKKLPKRPKIKVRKPNINQQKIIAEKARQKQESRREKLNKEVGSRENPILIDVETSVMPQEIKKTSKEPAINVDNLRERLREWKNLPKSSRVHVLGHDGREQEFGESVGVSWLSSLKDNLDKVYKNKKTSNLGFITSINFGLDDDKKVTLTVRVLVHDNEFFVKEYRDEYISRFILDNKITNLFEVQNKPCLLADSIEVEPFGPQIKTKTIRVLSSF